MNKLFSIGEMSKLHNISVQTLRYYDTIGLFQPVYINRENNYRYYSLEQFIYLDVIKYLKLIGMPLENIKDIINNHNSIKDLIEVMENNCRIIEDRIKALQNIKASMSRKISQLKESNNTDNLGKVYTRYIKEKKALSLELNHLTPYDDLNLPIRKVYLMVEKSNNIADGEIGFSCLMDEYAKTKEVHYKKIFTVINPEILDVQDESSLITIPEGEYVCILYRGFAEECLRSYRILYDYIVENNIDTSEIFYESSILEGVATANEIDYIMEIRILKK